MDESVFYHVLYRLANVEVKLFPYPHFYLENVFPSDFYQELVASLPDDSFYESLSKTGKVNSGAYQERFVLDLEEKDLGKLPFGHFVFWKKFASFFHSAPLIDTLLNKFDSPIKKRFGDKFEKIGFSSFAQLVRDRTNYSIGPHTDHPVRVMTLLFYFPKTEDKSHLGTSIYHPRHKDFECEGFSHHGFENFAKLHTASFIPNAVFGFLKTNNSFHGVEPIHERGVERNLMNYYIQWSHK